MPRTSQQMARDPLAVVVVSIASEEGLLAAQAMEAGAVESVRKPTSLANEKVLETKSDLVEKVVAAGRIPRARLRPLHLPANPSPLSELRQGRYEVLLLGLSTGGPPGFAIPAQSVPRQFPSAHRRHCAHARWLYRAFAQKLNELSALEVLEASHGLPMRAGRVVLGQAGQHLVLRREDEEVYCRLQIEPLSALHRPSVDVLFESAAAVYGKGALGVVLTGMGEDGKTGSAWIKAQGGSVLAEHESTCVVYGMPAAWWKRAWPTGFSLYPNCLGVFATW